MKQGIIFVFSWIFQLYILLKIVCFTYSAELLIKFYFKDLSRLDSSG